MLRKTSLVCYLINKKKEKYQKIMFRNECALDYRLEITDQVKIPKFRISN